MCNGTRDYVDLLAICLGFQSRLEYLFQARVNYSTKYSVLYNVRWSNVTMYEVRLLPKTLNDV